MVDSSEPGANNNPLAAPTAGNQAGEVQGEQAVAPKRQYYPFEFHGQATEYFKIWIVNIVLTIVTLGIYSAWAKVRTMRYFYGHTALDNSTFEYTAEPLKILRGRVLAVLLLIGYTALEYFSSTAATIGLAIFWLVLPVIVVMAFTFRMKYSRWRGIEFGFARDFRSAYMVFLPPLLLLTLLIAGPLLLGIDQAAIDASAESETPEISPELQQYFTLVSLLTTLGFLLYPWWQKLYYSFIGNHTRYGRSGFHIDLHPMEFYGIYAAAAAIFVGWMLGIGAIIGILAAVFPPAMAPALLLIMVPYLYTAAYIQTRRTNIVYGNLMIERVGFVSELKTGRMAWYYVSNTAAILVSLGLLIPWAMVRVARYRAECTRLYASDFDSFTALAEGESSATGDAMSDIFDIDLGV